MPRLSSAARAAAFFHVGRGLPAPKGMSPRARQLWREIVAARAPDFFDHGSAGLLRLYCTLSVYAEAVEARLDAGDRRAPGELRRTAASLVTLAVKLRLTPQAVHRRDAGILSERGAPLSPLLGGDAPGLRLIGGLAAQRQREGGE